MHVYNTRHYTGTQYRLYKMHVCALSHSLCRLDRPSPLYIVTYSTPLAVSSTDLTRIPTQEQSENFLERGPRAPSLRVKKMGSPRTRIARERLDAPRPGWGAAAAPVANGHWPAVVGVGHRRALVAARRAGPPGQTADQTPTAGQASQPAHPACQWSGPGRPGAGRVYARPPV